MRINIIGTGSFGSFLRRELPKFGFEIIEGADSVILAVPYSAYESVASALISRKKDIHLINMCSMQSLSTNILLGWTDKVTSIHPLFGARTPEDKRNSIVTHEYTAGYSSEWNEERQFLVLFGKFSDLHYCDYSKPLTADDKYPRFTPESHDILMAKTQAAAVLAAKQLKHFVDAAADIPDELIPNSFRLLRQFVKTLDDMPTGTIESIMANPYI